jgi:hypothetical protein
VKGGISVLLLARLSVYSAGVATLAYRRSASPRATPGVEAVECRAPDPWGLLATS